MEKVIKKGNHRSSRWPEFTFKNSLSGEVKFVGDFSYSIAAEKQKDTNKLIGLSDGLNHQRNSIRLGWRWSEKDNKIEIMSIRYNNGLRIIDHITYAESDKFYEYSINIWEGVYYVKFGGTGKGLTRTSKWNFLRVKLGFYFGGTEKASKDFKIEMA